MKFQKGLLTDEENPPAPAEPARTEAVIPEPVVVEKDRLFQTVKEEDGSERNYLKVLAVVAVIVLIAGVAVTYLMQPGIGDAVRAPKGLEDSVRDHFLTKEKREATDIIFYQCSGYYWARVGVVTRPDIANPVYKIASYKARASASGDKWDISAEPITSPEMDKPCN